MEVLRLEFEDWRSFPASLQAIRDRKLLQQRNVWGLVRASASGFSNASLDSACPNNRGHLAGLARQARQACHQAIVMLVAGTAAQVAWDR